MVLRHMELVNAAPDSVVEKSKNPKHRYQKCRKDGFGKKTRKELDE